MPEVKTGANKRIVVGVDGSPASDAALRWALAEAELTGDNVEAIMAWQYPISVGSYGWAPVIMEDGGNMAADADKALHEAVTRAMDGHSGVTIEQRCVEGYPPSILVDASADADLLVVGSRGHGTFTDALLGSVSQHCSHHSKCPVVIVRGRQQ